MCYLRSYFCLVISLVVIVGVYSQSGEDLLDSINANIRKGDYQKNVELFGEYERLSLLDNVDCVLQSKLAHRVGVSLYYQDKNFEAAEFYINKVLPSWEDCPNRKATDLANSLYNTGVSLQFANFYQEARPYFYNSLKLFESDTTYSVQRLSAKYAGIARFYKDNQDYIRSIDYYKTAIELISNEEELLSRKATYYNNLGIALNESGRYDEASVFFKKAQVIHKRMGDERKGVMASYNLAISSFGMDSVSQAKSDLLEVMEWEGADSTLLSSFYELLGLINKKEERFTESELAFRQSLEIRELVVEDRKILSSSYENLAELYESVDPVVALKYIDSAILLLVVNAEFDELNNPVVKGLVTLNNLAFLRALSIKARILESNRRRVSDTQEVLEIYNKIDSLFTLNTFNLHFEQSRLSYIDLVHDVYIQAVEFCQELHRHFPYKNYDELGFKYATRTKALALYSELKENDWYASQGSSQIEAERIELSKDMRHIYAQVIKDNGRDAGLVVSYLAAQRELEVLLEGLENKSTKRFQDKYDLLDPLTIEGIQNKLSAHQLYTEFFFGADAFYSFNVTQDTFFSMRHGDILKIKNLISDLSTMMRDRSSSMDALNEVRQSLSAEVLIGALKDEVLRKKEWLIVPDDVLHGLSFDLLTVGIDDAAYLIESMSIGLSYSSNLLFYNDEGMIKPEYQGFGTNYTSSLSAGDMGSSEQIDSVPYDLLSMSEREINLSQEVMGGDAFVGDQATKHAFVREWGKANITHLSLHGIVDLDFFEKSCLIFDRSKSDYILNLSDIYTMTNASDLIVLSSCHTASGKYFRGEGIQGLTKVFMKSGKTTVVSSLWEASEVSSFQIIPHFFTYLKKGDSVSRSLQMAKKRYLAEAAPSQRHPYYWANFQVIGQGDVVLDQRNIPIYWVLIGVGLLIGILGVQFFSKKVAA